MKKNLKKTTDYEEKSEKEHVIKLNPKIYPLALVFKAAYILIDTAYIVVDGDPESELLVFIRSKGDVDAKTLAERFNDELINFSVYESQSKKNAVLRQEYLKRALLTNITKTDDDYIEDKEGIFVPWEEKYG